ncbi:Arm DNA-binding domain-containing protein [Aeromonas veronii]|uniref:Arm DNA-binding domain-containing protein n=1 Tax=Aeromonas veronii TaxID=654 RepID=UPI0024441DEC|nr:Arm DNA-binding domain-containing protein [Aeromonas veronii]
MALLTDTKARNLKLGDKAIAHGGVTGLALHPSTAKGRGNWVLRYVSPVTGKRRNAGLGSYPKISIADATKQGQKMREQLANGLDPLDSNVLKRANPLSQLSRLLLGKFIPNCYLDGKTPNTANSGSRRSSSMHSP